MIAADINSVRGSLSAPIVVVSHITADIIENRLPESLDLACNELICDPDLGCTVIPLEDYTDCLPMDDSELLRGANPGTECSSGTCIAGRCYPVNRLPFLFSTFCGNNLKECGRTACVLGRCENSATNSLTYEDEDSDDLWKVGCVDSNNPCVQGECRDAENNDFRRGADGFAEGLCEHSLDAHPEECVEIPDVGLFTVEGADGELEYRFRHDRFEADFATVGDITSESVSFYTSAELAEPVHQVVPDPRVPERDDRVRGGRQPVRLHVRRDRYALQPVQ